MGRPKGSKNKPKFSLSTESKNISPTSPTTNSISQPTPSTSLLAATTKPSKYALCPLCGKEIYSSPYTIRLTDLTGVSTYHRQVEDVYKVCGDCAGEFSEYVEKWLIKKGAKKKIGYV